MKKLKAEKHMNDIEKTLKEENENNKELFNLNGNEAQLKHIKEVFLKSVQRGSNYYYYYFIQLLEHYSQCRPRQHYISKELVECIYSCFPEQINEIQEYIKEDTDILKFIIFPEEFTINENKKHMEMFSLLQKDDIDGFISFLSKNPTIDITKK